MWDGEGSRGESLEDRTGQKQKENREGCREWGRMWQVGGKEPDGKNDGKVRRQWLPQNQPAALWWLSHSYFGGVNFLPIWGNFAGVLTYLECLRLHQPVIAD